MGLERIAIVGTGAWGAALANALARAGRSVSPARPAAAPRIARTTSLRSTTAGILGSAAPRANDATEQRAVASDERVGGVGQRGKLRGKP